MNVEYYSSAALVTAVVVYLLALSAYAAEWAAARKVSAGDSAEERALAGVAASSSQASSPDLSSASRADVDSVAEQRMADLKVELWGRIGVALTVVGFLCSVLGTALRGVAAGRPPWGNMYEFTITAMVLIVAAYLVLVWRTGPVGSACR